METARLNLRQWKKEDLLAFAELNADPRVMEFFSTPLAKGESDAFAECLSNNIEEQGWGLWAVERLDNQDFIGFVGLSCPSIEDAVFPCIELGWRLKFDAWGFGFATEAANECLRFAFQDLKLNEIVSFSAEENIRSIKVMEKLGMRHSKNDGYDHPVLYRLTKKNWLQNALICERIGNY